MVKVKSDEMRELKSNLDEIRKFRQELKAQTTALFTHIIPGYPRYVIMYYRSLRSQGIPSQLIELTFMDDEEFERNALSTEIFSHWIKNTRLTENEIQNIFSDKLKDIEEEIKKEE